MREGRSGFWPGIPTRTHARPQGRRGGGERGAPPPQPFPAPGVCMGRTACPGHQNTAIVEDVGAPPPHPASCLLGRKSIKLPHRRQGSDAGTARDPHVRLRATAGRGRHGEDEALGPGRTSTGSEDAGSGGAEPGSGRPRSCSRADPGTRFEHESFHLAFQSTFSTFLSAWEGSQINGAGLSRCRVFRTLYKSGYVNHFT